MTAGSIRLDRGPRFQTLCLALLALALWLAPVARAQTASAAPATQAAPANRANTEAQIEKIVANLHNMTSAQILAQLEPLLQGDLSGVLTSVKVAGFSTVAAAHERLAQDARLNRLDPAAERKAQEELDKAAQAYVSGAEVASADTDYVAADQLYSRALSFRPNLPKALLGLARVYAAQPNKALQALERYQQYLSATDQGGGRTVSEPKLYVEMGRVYANANLWHQAMKSYRQAVANGLDNDEVAALLARCHMALGQVADAFQYAEQAIAKASDQPGYYLLYAELLTQRGEFAKARDQAALGIDVAKQRLQKQPDDQATLSLLNDCFSAYHRALEQIIMRTPADVDSRLALVKAMQEQMDVVQLLSFHRALAVLRGGPEKQRNSVPVLEEQIRLQKLIGHAGLRETCQRLLEKDPGNTLAKDTLAAVNAASQPAAAQRTR